MIEVGSAASLVAGIGCTVTSIIAAKAAEKSYSTFQKSKQAKDSLPNNNAGNFSNHIKETYGDPPSDGNKYQAHHMLPQQKDLQAFFKRNGLDIHDAKYGSWVEAHKHLSEAKIFNADWKKWILDHSDANIEDILNYARQLAKKYGYIINF